MRAAIQAGRVEFPSPQWDSVSASAKGLINQLLQVDPRKRLDAAAMLRHPWVKGQNVSATPIRGSGRQLQEYQRAAAKWKATLLSSLHRQAAIRRQRDASADPSSERELLSDAFKAFDPHGQGYVLAQDLERVLKRSSGGHFTPEEMAQV
jgi:serine/threonine protein kinase